LQLVIDSVWLTIALLVAVVLVPPLLIGVAIFRQRGAVGNSLDRLLWLYFVGETAVMLVLYRTSSGAWLNYAIQPAVFLAVLAGRALGRALDSTLPPRSQVLITLGALVCLASAASSIKYAETRRQIDRAAFAAFRKEAHCDPSQVFVVDHPGMNRLHGRLDLVYDDWLYPVFESMGLAQPRSIWLRRILLAGSIRYVVNKSDEPRLDGIAQTLPELGYFRKYHVGSFYIWERRTPSRSIRAGAALR
jgi:hypothetical protein